MTVQQPIPAFFADKLNQCLDEVDAPHALKERADILTKMFHISRQEAWNWLEGRQIPDQEMIKKIATEFDVEINWLNDNS